MKYAKEHEIDKIGLVVFPEKTILTAKAKELATANITVTEANSRLGFFYGTVRTLMDAGYTEAQALEIGKNMTRDLMGNMEKHARAGITTETGLLGAALGRLQSYSILSFTMFSQAAADMALGLKTTNPKLLIPFGAFIAGQYLRGGVS